MFWSFSTDIINSPPQSRKTIPLSIVQPQLNIITVQRAVALLCRHKGLFFCHFFAFAKSPTVLVSAAWYIKECLLYGGKNLKSGSIASPDDLHERKYLYWRKWAPMLHALCPMYYVLPVCIISLFPARWRVLADDPTWAGSSWIGMRIPFFFVDNRVKVL